MSQRAESYKCNFCGQRRTGKPAMVRELTHTPGKRLRVYRFMCKTCLRVKAK